MTNLSIGDLAQSFQLRRQNVFLKTEQARLSNELTTGQSADLGHRLAGNFVPLSGIERSLGTLAAYKTATAEAALMADAMQSSLSVLGNATETISSALLLAGDAPQAGLLSNAGIDSESKLDQVTAALNTRVAGRTLFAGAATDKPAIISATDLMRELRAAVAGATSADDIMSALDTWFDTPGGGFETIGYLGSPSPAGPAQLTEGQTVSLDETALDPSLREVLKGLAAGALLADASVLAGDLPERAALAKRAGMHLISATGPLTTLQARIGSVQNQIETLDAQNSAQNSMLEIARSKLIGVDPYDAATELQAIQGQIETHYTLTARLSRLTLADYLS